MKKCPRCGHEVNEQEKYCPHCGLDLKGKYRPIKQKNKAMTYLLYVIIFFSIITIPLFYSRLLNNIGNETSQLEEKGVELPKREDVQPQSILAVYDTLADFNKQFTNVEGITNAITNYEKTLSALGEYQFDKEYSIVVLDNYNIYYTLTYTTKISDQLSVSIERQYDRAHSYNTEKIVFQKNSAQTFDDLFLTLEQLDVVKTFTGEQTTTDQLIEKFKGRQADFESQKKTLGHYGIGEYDGRSSFVAHRKGQTYYSELTYVHEMSEYIDEGK